MKHFNIIITGKVQGVWYRQSALETALKLGITGFVRNEPDGSVYIEAEGEETQLRQFVDWCKQGPPRAIVKSVSSTESQIKNISAFEITR